MPHRLFSFLLSFLAAAFLSVPLALPCAAQQTIVKVKPKTTTTKKKTTTTTTRKKTTTTKKKTTNRAATSVISTSQCVDLGLSVKWAGYNVGASHPEEAGNYYAWGELYPKAEYTENTYKYYSGGGDNYNPNKYINIGDSISGNSSYDVARVQWGYPWRMPTKAECEELLKRCTWTRTTYRGMNGYKVTGPNGNAIFLPAAGYRYGTSLFLYGKCGYYWQGTQNDSSYMDGARGLAFDSSYHSTSWYHRMHGQSVRPVSD